MKTLSLLLLLLLLLFSSILAVALANQDVSSVMQLQAASFLWDTTVDNNKQTNRNDDGNTRLIVHVPFQYYKEQGEDHEVARWGGANVGWSGTLAEFVYYYDKPLCHHVEWNDTTFPFHPNTTKDGIITPFILMAPPGPCSPVLWARRAQFVGAAALMIVDNVCPCDDQACPGYSAETCRQAGKPVLIDDGTAGDVSIPVWLVPKTIGQALVDTAVKDNQPILVEFAWGLPAVEDDNDKTHQAHNKTVKYELWTAAANDPQLTASNVQELRQLVKALPDHLLLQPKFRLLDGIRFHCPQFKDASPSPCDHLCTNGGRYCAMQGKNLTGHTVVKETLRRLCIWNHYPPSDYWDYWVHHTTVCKEPHLYGDEDCIKQGLHEANMDPKIITDCMDESGNVDQDMTNAWLKGMIEEQQVSGAVKLPSIIHADTHSPLDHGASAHSLFESVCYHFYWKAKSTNMHWEDIPKLCETCFECTNLMGCLEHNECVPMDHHDSGSGGKGGSKGQGHHEDWERRRNRRRRRFRFFVFLLVAGLGGYGYYYYQQQQRNMYAGGTGGGLLGSYLQLSGTDN